MTDREDFELKISMEYEQPPCLDRDGEGYDNSYVDNAWWGWQAARAIDAKRIADFGRYQIKTEGVIATLENTILDLEAQNKAMREVLQAYSENKKIGLAATCVLAALDKEGE